MATLEKIKSKVTRIDIDELIKRLKMELNIKEAEKAAETQNTESTNSNVDAQTLLEYAMYDTLLIVLDVTHLKKVDDSLYSIWVNMIKDYWYLNNYDTLLNGTDEDDTTENLEVSSIKEGDTQVNFSKKNTININGTYYSTGTINFDENILREKYKKDLYRHRVMRW